VKELLRQGHSINERNPGIKFGWTPLIAAIYQGKTNVAHYLISTGADVNIPDSIGKTALMWATVWGDDALDMVKDLIAHGADLSAKDKMGATVLSYASSPKLAEVIQAATAQQQQTR